MFVSVALTICEQTRVLVCELESARKYRAPTGDAGFTSAAFLFDPSSRVYTLRRQVLRQHTPRAEQPGAFVFAVLVGGS